MKKITTALIFLGIFSVSGFSKEALSGNNWTFFGETNGQMPIKHYFDPQSATKNGSEVVVNIYNQYVQPQAAQNLSIGGTILQQALDCSKKTVKVLKVTFIDPSGKVINVPNFEMPTFEQPIGDPDAPMTSLFNRYCK